VVDEKEAPYLKRLTPLELIRAGDSTEIWLDCTRAQLSTLRPFLEIEDFKGNGLHTQYTAKMYSIWPKNVRRKLPVPIKLEQLAPETVKIHGNNRVKVTDGNLGRVSQFLVNPITKKATALVVRWRTWWKVNEALVPISQVDHFEEDLVFLKLSKLDLQEAGMTQLQHNYI
jgi:hypothetical protein